MDTEYGIDSAVAAVAGAAGNAHGIVAFFVMLGLTVRSLASPPAVVHSH